MDTKIRATAYIAGPMTGIQDWNIPAFAAMADLLRSKGIDCINPHELHEPDPDTPWDWYLRRDLKSLADCDVLVLLPGWENSRGATLEHCIAAALEFRIVYPGGLDEWLGEL